MRATALGSGTVVKSNSLEEIAKVPSCPEDEKFAATKFVLPDHEASE
jgi:hypothetical protein